MAAYKDLIGQKITKVTSNPSEPKTGQMWYNSTNGKLRGLGIVEAWSSAPPTSSNLFRRASAGTATSAFLASGDTGTTPTIASTTEEYNGSGFSNGGNVNTARFSAAASGNETAGLIFGGFVPPYSNATESYNGSSWTTTPYTLNTARFVTMGCGTSTSALCFGGLKSPSNALSGDTEEYDGEGWTAGNSMNTSRESTGQAGIQTAALAFGGYSTTFATNSENYDGTSWSNTNSMNTARFSLGGAGTSTSAIAYGGQGPGSPGMLSATETWDGSSWTTSPATLATARYHLGDFGSSTNAFAAGGSTPTAQTITEEYNKSTNTITAAAWASGGATNTALGTTAGNGTQTAGMIYGGTENANNSELYDGSSWTAAPTLNTGRYGAGEANSAPQTTSLVFGGYANPPGTNYAVTEEWNGSSWSNQNDMPVSMRQLSGFGIQTAAVTVGGWSTDYVSESYEYDGTNWTAGGNINTARERAASFGLESAGATVGGNVPPSHAHTDTAEEYNGSSWTTATTYPTGIKHAAACGTQTDGLVFSGNTPPNSVTGLTLGYDGTSWSTRPSMGTARQAGAGAGTSTAALMSAGSNVGGTSLTTTEEFTGETTAANIADFTTS